MSVPQVATEFRAFRDRLGSEIADLTLDGTSALAVGQVRAFGYAEGQDVLLQGGDTLVSPFACVLSDMVEPPADRQYQAVVASSHTGDALTTVDLEVQSVTADDDGHPVVTLNTVGEAVEPTTFSYTESAQGVGALCLNGAETVPQQVLFDTYGYGRGY